MRQVEPNASSVCNGTKSSSISSLEATCSQSAVPRPQQKPPEKHLGFWGPTLRCKGLCLCLPGCTVSWVESETDVSLGSFLCGLLGFVCLAPAVQVGWEGAAGGAEEHLQVSQLPSGIRLLSCQPWSCHMQHWCLFIYKKRVFLTPLCAFPLADV